MWLKKAETNESVLGKKKNKVNEETQIDDELRTQECWVNAASLSMKIALSSSSSSSSTIPVLRHAAAFTLQSVSSTSYRNRKSNLIRVMAKSKKPSSSHTPSQGSSDPPPRITSNVKQNLQFLKLWKELEKRRSSTPRPATSYRRKKVEKEIVPVDTQEIYRDPTFTLYHTNHMPNTAFPVLLVDGYNVCGYWIKLKKHFMSGRLDIARQKLVNELIAFSVHKEVKVVVVFDAMMSGLPTHKETFACVDIIYSGETCADSWIEREVMCLRQDGCPKVWVVTSDHKQQDAAHGAGAFVWSCKALVSEIKAAQKEVDMMIQEQRPTSFQGKLLKHNLNSEVVGALKDLRNKLYENERKK